MRTLTIGLIVVMLFAAGCGVNKDFVSSEIAASEARTGAQLTALGDKTDANTAEVARLQQLSRELDAKAEMAINKAKGFENYQIIWSGEINFAFDSYDIDGVASAILDEAGMKMEEVPGALLEIAGHADKTGSAKYNLLIGEKRANAAKRYLADKFGVSLYRLFIVSYGEEKPIAMPDEKNASSKNRRVNLNIWGEL